MKRRHFDITENAELRVKIDGAKRRLALPALMGQLGLGAHAKKTARCPFPGHEDKHPSFSVFQGKDGFWHYKCFTGCGDGDEIGFLRKLKGLSMTDAINLYLDMAGFPPGRHPKSHECPKPRGCPVPPNSPRYPELPESPMSLGSPMSNGQALQAELKDLAAHTPIKNQFGR